ncbi:MAG: rhodanese-like domain-containing protein [Pseudomonadales bacterium]|jgi:rhodanese-related sulfurtransferase
MTLKKGYQALLDEAARSVRTLSVEEARELHGRPDVQFIDLRDPRELEREGKIPGAFHAPRGMLEFWVDPESPYYKDVFAPGKTFVFYCQSGWRSALATRTVQDMGLANVCHVGGGYRAWKDAGAATEAQPPRGA